MNSIKIWCHVHMRYLDEKMGFDYKPFSPIKKYRQADCVESAIADTRKELGGNYILIDAWEDTERSEQELEQRALKRLRRTNEQH